MGRALTGLASFLFALHAVVAPFVIFCFVPGPGGHLRMELACGACCENDGCGSPDRVIGQEIRCEEPPCCGGCEDLSLWDPSLPEGVPFPCHEEAAFFLFSLISPCDVPESHRVSAADFRPVRDGPPLYLNHCHLSL